MSLFNIDNFMPHGHCYLWQTDILLMNVISDIIISLCYLAIPLLITVILWRRKDLPFKSTIRVFAVFIFFCSLTHVMEIVNVWYPFYYLTGILKSMTAIISVGSTYIILKSIKKILELPSLSNLEHRLFDDVHHVMEKLPVGLILSDRRGRINYHNEYINNLFEYSREELNNKEVEILIDQINRKKHIQQKEEYFEKPTEKSMGGGRVLQGKTKSGDLKFLEIGLRPISLQSSHLTLVTIKDITTEEESKRKVAETLKLINVATYGMPSLLSYIDKDGTYQFVNEAYTRKWDVKSEKVLNCNYKEFLPEGTLAAIEQKMNQALSGEELNFKIRVNFPKEGLRELDVSYKPYRSKESNIVEGVVVLAHDITEINNTLKDLEASNKQLEEYVFLVSHDLRAPIRHITNFIELLFEQLGSEDQNQEKIEKYTSIIKANSIKIQGMISGMLKIASINQIVPQFESTNINSFFNKLSISYKGLVQFDLSIMEMIDINCDEGLLESIFLNLIENSISHSQSAETRVKIHVSMEFNKVTIDYKDFGVGISSELAKSIFNPFIKSQESQGLGLGMTIVSRSLEKIHGEIKCLPSQEGAHFEIQIVSN
jgi:PAS domain S-box-containing protein